MFAPPPFKGTLNFFNPRIILGVMFARNTRLFSLLDVFSKIGFTNQLLTLKKKQNKTKQNKNKNKKQKQKNGQIVLQKIIILISSYLPYTHGHYAMV